MEPAESVLVAGYRLDRYELLCPIASGGMATVWLARLRSKRGFEKLFAIKTIRTELVDDPRFQEMFFDEARIASGIQHPNVAQILDLGEQQDVLFIVMEWVDGDSLAKLRKLVTKLGGRLPVGFVLRVLADAAAGLHAAHQLHDDKGQALEIVHRDVSPHNILVATNGAVKVIDFGIAKAQNRRQGTTRTGVVKGKIQYMAPEQVKKSRSVDRRTDIWALGVILHELVSGKLPYDGDDDVEVIRRLAGDEPPTVATDFPAPISAILARSVVLDPTARFGSAADMQRALEAAMKQLGETTTSDDVAAFLRSELPELAERRRDVVGKAISEARLRSVPPGQVPEADVAFAPTIISERTTGQRSERKSNVATIELTKKKDGSGPKRPWPAAVGTLEDSNSRIASAEILDDEPIKIPKSSRAFLWVMLFVFVGAAAAAFAFPSEARRVLSVVGLSSGPGPTQPAVAPTPSSEPAVIATSAASSAASLSAATEASASAAAAAPSVAPASSSVPAASVRRPEPAHHTWPTAPGIASSKSGAAPSSGPGAQPAASTTMSRGPADKSIMPSQDSGVPLSPLSPLAPAPSATDDQPYGPGD
jgi:serine/threonine-protein kinase